MIQLPAAIEIKGESLIGCRLQVESADARALINLSKYWCKGSTVVLHDENVSRARSVENEMIQLPAAIEIKGKDPICSGFQVKSADARALINLPNTGVKVPPLFFTMKMFPVPGR